MSNVWKLLISLRVVRIFSFCILFLFYFNAFYPTLAQEAGASRSKKKGGIRLRNIARIEGIRSNQLIGYGLVAGLPGTGDSRSRLADESMSNLLERLGQKSSSDFHAKNIAAVLVTAELNSFARKGDRIDAVVSSIGDARSLEGGMLVLTPLMAGNQEIYAVAQGMVLSGGKNSGKSRVRSTGKTLGTVLNGALVEKNLAGDFITNRQIRVSLNRFDFSIFEAMKKAIMEEFKDYPVKSSGGTLEIDLPSEVDSHGFIAALEDVKIDASFPARVVINERTGTVVMGGDIRIDPVSISRKGLNFSVGGGTGIGTGISDELVIKYGPGASNKDSAEEKGVSREFSGNSVSEIVEALNAMGAGVDDIIAILEALKDSGALHAELIVM